MIRGTPAQIHALDQYIATSSFKEGATRLGWSERAFRRRLDELRQSNAMTLVELIAARGARKAA